MVTSSTRGWSRPPGQQLAQHPGRGALADGDAAGHADDERRRRRRRRLAEEGRRRRGAARAAARDLQVEQPGQRQVDLLDLGQVDRLAEPAQPRQVVVVERQRGGRAQRAPPRRGRSTTYGDGRRGGPGLLPRRIPCHPCAESWATSATSRRSTSSSRVCAGWSTAATTRPASRARRRQAGHGEAGRQAGQPRDGAGRAARCPPATTGIGHTRWATHGAPDRPQRPPAPSTAPAGSRSSTTASSRTSPSCAPSWRSAAHELAQRHRHRGGRAPARGGDRDRRRRRGRPRRGDARGSAAGWRARSPWSPSTPTPPTSWSGARRNSPLVVGRGEGENFLASDVAAFIAHTREAVELGQDQVVELRRDGIDDHRLRRRARPTAREYHVDWDASAAEKGGYDYFMLKEIAEQPQAVADTLLGRLDDDGRLVARRDAALRRGPARRRQDHHHRLRHRVPRRPGREVRHRALDPDPVRGRAGQRVPLPRPGPRPARRWSSRSPSPARRWTR